MPFDGKPENFTKVDTSLAALIAWLEKQPADGTYDYLNIHDCLICRWLKDITGSRHATGSGGHYLAWSVDRNLAQKIEVGVSIEGDVAAAERGDTGVKIEPRGRTYGDALTRARQLAAEGCK